MDASDYSAICHLAVLAGGFAIHILAAWPKTKRGYPIARTDKAPDRIYSSKGCFMLRSASSLRVGPVAAFQRVLSNRVLLLSVAQKLNRRGEPQVLVHVSTYQGKPSWYLFFEPQPALTDQTPIGSFTGVLYVKDCLPLFKSRDQLHLANCREGSKQGTVLAPGSLECGSDVREFRDQYPGILVPFAMIRGILGGQLYVHFPNPPIAVRPLFFTLLPVEMGRNKKTGPR